MTFNRNKPHGVISGHEWAKYEQDGVLYDYSGNTKDGTLPVDEKVAETTEETQLGDPYQMDYQLAQAKAFLKNILAGGPVSRSNIFKECEANNQDWDKVKTAFSQIGEKISRRNIVHWQLKPE